MSVVGTIGYYYGFATGSSLLPSGIAGALSGLTPILSYLLAPMILSEEKTSALKTSGIATGFPGVLLIANPFATGMGSAYLEGVLHNATGSVSIGASFVYAKKYLIPQKIPVAALISYQLGLSALVLLVVIDLQGIGAIWSDAPYGAMPMWPRDRCSVLGSLAPGWLTLSTIKSSTGSAPWLRRQLPIFRLWRLSSLAFCWWMKPSCFRNMPGPHPAIGAAGPQRSNSPFGPGFAEPVPPVPRALPVPSTPLRRIRPAHPVMNTGKRKQTPGLTGIFARPGKAAKGRSIIVITTASSCRHRKSSLVCMDPESSRVEKA